MPFVQGESLSQLLKDRSVEGRPVLNPQISDRSLKRAYREMAAIVLELSKLEFDTMGALEEHEGKFGTSKRTLTFNMNELMVSANIPDKVFPSKPFQSAKGSEEDCRKKFLARFLFLNVIRDVFAEHSQGSFRLYCDDLRPSNVLVSLSDLRVSAVIDWEFTYAAPAEFTYVAPWWLLLQSPEDWEADLNEFLTRYNPKLRVFLEALEERENTLIEQNILSESQRLSLRMRQSVENGLFWICLAARYSSMFDEIYWTFVEQQYYGTFTSSEHRMQQLSDEQQRELHEAVEAKMQQSTGSEEDFHDHYPIDELLEL
ncbi:hypothetical protein BJX61DRAFT_545467 [Aspergillus egyptiacus]|nr:hypothetical protein BJX61DRAFT_545467 [Aspergillus egyptiacus]